VHFVDDDRMRGGHVLDFEMTNGMLEICIGTDLDLRLPLSSAFQSAELTPRDLSVQLGATENERPAQ
jgi:acetolactate decarboxylase